MYNNCEVPFIKLLQFLQWRHKYNVGWEFPNNIITMEIIVVVLILIKKNMIMFQNVYK